MSDTPRTDAEASDGWTGDAVCVSADFARTLELEIAALREDKARLDWLESEQGEPDFPDASDGERNVVIYTSAHRLGSGAGVGKTLRAAIDMARAGT